MEGTGAERAPGRPETGEAGEGDRGAAEEGYPVATSDRFFVLVNPRAADGEEASFRRRLAAAFAEHDVPFDLYVADDPSDAVEMARRAARSGCRAVAAAGGDGTVARALQGTAGTEVPVAILPFGTGNQLALNFGVPDALEGSVRVAVEGRPESIDLGTVDGRYFALIAGAGLDAEVMAAATDELKQKLGFGAYLLSGLKKLVSSSSAEFHLRVDGEEVRVEATMVLLANAGQLAAGSLPMEVQVGPRVSFRDGLIDVCIYRPKNLPEMAQVLWKVAHHDYAGDDRMFFLQAEHVELESDPPVAVQVDGEPAGETPVEVGVEPAAARILVPA